MRYLILGIFLFTTWSTHAETLSEARPNTFSIEALGKGGLYSFSYDRTVSTDVSLGIGAAFFKGTYEKQSYNIVTIPFHGYFFFNQNRIRPFLVAGFDLVFISSPVEKVGNISRSGTIYIVGAGYEYRSEMGILVRATPYLFMSSVGASAWFGLSAGFSF